MMDHRSIDDIPRGSHLGQCRHECLPVLERPAVMLRVGQLETIGAKACGPIDDLAGAIDIGAVQDDVDGERKSELAHDPGGRQFLRNRAHAGNPIGGVCFRILNRDLDVLEPGLA
jgi:hypothetical protein